MHKKPEFWKKFLLIKNPQFLTNFDETLPTGPKNELVNWTKFHPIWVKIVDFSLIGTFSRIPVFYA